MSIVKLKEIQSTNSKFGSPFPIIYQLCYVEVGLKEAKLVNQSVTVIVHYVTKIRNKVHQAKTQDQVSGNSYTENQAQICVPAICNSFTSILLQLHHNMIIFGIKPEARKIQF
jgi:hypothetical protein